ncbi:hypothetical protein TcasGA2_TC002387 [Tribolium castaneum]|uniref:Uncharacterized protein n=1 Tax=Tribolium castaneum TaxID=7070 RepID=D7GYF0_TRICA|nr:hypothetical protein TcasGA2_TC002387 [Tribolium castaneum]
MASLRKTKVEYCNFDIMNTLENTMTNLDFL